MNAKIRLAALAATVSLVLIVAAPVQAGTSMEVIVTDGTSFAGTDLESGTYTLRVKKNGSKDSVVVSLFKNGRKVATAEGRREARDERLGSGVGYNNDGNGGREISEIRNGTKTVIVIQS